MNHRVSGKPFRILSLDGGGTYALLQAKALADLYPGQDGHQVLSHFDLVSACSGGSIVAAALIEGYSPDQIFDLFDNAANRNELFGRLPWPRRLMSLVSGTFMPSPIGRRFSADGKLNFLRRILPDYGPLHLDALPDALNPRLNALRARRGAPPGDLALLVMAYDFDRDRSRMLRSHRGSPAAHFPRAAQSITLAEAAHASSTAPINWFDKPAEVDSRRYWDGAMTGYNNPVLAGVVEAVAMGARPADIGVLSVGTSTVFLPEQGTPGMPPELCQPRPNNGFARELLKVGRLIIADPPDAHSFIAHLMLGGGLPVEASECPFGRTSVVRLNPVVQPVVGPDGRWQTPAGWSVADFHRIADLDIAATKEDDVDLIKRMCRGWMADAWENQPIRRAGSFAAPPSAGTTSCEIGHPRYSIAKQAWLALAPPGRSERTRAETADA